MSVFSGPTLAKKVYPLLPSGEFVATLSDLTYEQGGTYGDSLLWKWLLANPATPTNYITRDDGDEKIHHEYTPIDIILGSKSHEWIASLTGRVLAEGEEPPEDTDLVGNRILVYIAHQAPKMGPNKGVLRERFVQGTSKPFTLVPPKKIAPNVVHAPVQAEADEEEANRLKLIAEAERQIAKAQKFGTPNADTWVGTDLSELADDALHLVIRDTKAEIQAALDA